MRYSRQTDKQRQEHVCILFCFLLTDDHLEALWVVLYKGLSLHCLRKEGFRDQWEAHTPQHLHYILLSVTHVILQPAHCCIVNLHTSTRVGEASTLYFI